MSDEKQPHTTLLGQYGGPALKAVLTGLLMMAIFIFNEMNNAVSEIQKVVTEMSGIVIRLDAKVENNKEDIIDVKQDVKRLQDVKADKN